MVPLERESAAATPHFARLNFRLLLHAVLQTIFISLCSPRWDSFLIRVFVSFVSISKCPAHRGLWDTIHTAIWPTTTTGWEGTRAPTAGPR